MATECFGSELNARMSFWPWWSCPSLALSFLDSSLVLDLPQAVIALRKAEIPVSFPFSLSDCLTAAFLASLSTISLPGMPL